MQQYLSNINMPFIFNMFNNISSKCSFTKAECCCKAQGAKVSNYIDASVFVITLANVNATLGI
jgi:hypothetical protein